ncbi:uncharacterized protein Bfra_004081 [Botrytis fragariae]|uniref:Uncharacterized protein n=1 Tax=Botrytis fragariae TaxID=1964551 RepID=A0A8H6AUU5_9HELO|nr:uncharacterized protein Bfra_004081 [Botrytis fragariae]KAF5874074.1 hypothetical protein Bfra_004081 [Botrytis fragariae]
MHPYPTNKARLQRVINWAQDGLKQKEKEEKFVGDIVPQIRKLTLEFLISIKNAHGLRISNLTHKEHSAANVVKEEQTMVVQPYI